jgi:hypothetical protein
MGSGVRDAVGVKCAPVNLFPAFSWAFDISSPIVTLTDILNRFHLLTRLLSLAWFLFVSVHIRYVSLISFEFLQNILRITVAISPTQTRGRIMQSEPPRKPKKRTNDAPPSPRAAPCPLAPAPTNASDEPIQQAPLQKRHRRTLTDEERLEVAATRKRGACDECRRKKEKVCSLPT